MGHKNIRKINKFIQKHNLPFHFHSFKLSKQAPAYSIGAPFLHWAFEWPWLSGALTMDFDPFEITFFTFMRLDICCYRVFLVADHFSMGSMRIWLIFSWFILLYFLYLFLSSFCDRLSLKAESVAMMEKSVEYFFNIW